MSNPDPLQATLTLTELARSIRFALVAILLCLSYLTVRSSLDIGNYVTLFSDLFGGRPLPLLTKIVFEARMLFTGLSFLIPAIALSTLFSRHLAASFTLLGALALATLVHWSILHVALTVPTARVMRAVSVGQQL